MSANSRSWMVIGFIGLILIGVALIISPLISSGGAARRADAGDLVHDECRAEQGPRPRCRA